VVSSGSASPPAYENAVLMNANHINMTKFYSREGQGYQDVLGKLRRMIDAMKRPSPPSQRSKTIQPTNIVP
jgi:hypothetical protein